MIKLAYDYIQFENGLATNTIYTPFKLAEVIAEKYKYMKFGYKDLCYGLIISTDSTSMQDTYNINIDLLLKCLTNSGNDDVKDILPIVTEFQYCLKTC